MPLWIICNVHGSNLATRAIRWCRCGCCSRRPCELSRFVFVNICLPLFVSSMVFFLLFFFRQTVIFPLLVVLFSLSQKLFFFVSLVLVLLFWLLISQSKATSKAFGIACARSLDISLSRCVSFSHFSFYITYWCIHILEVFSSNHFDATMCDFGFSLSHTRTKFCCRSKLYCFRFRFVTWLLFDIFFIFTLMVRFNTIS